MNAIKKGAMLFISFVLTFALAGCGSSRTEIGGQTSQAESTADSVQESSVSGEAEQNAATSETDQAEELAEEDSEPESDDISEGNGTDVLVVYFSRTGEQYEVGVIDKGNTAIVADMIIEATGADSFEILPANDIYPITYNELTDVAKKEQNENARPEIAGELPDISQYSTIFIGAPVWWGDWPMICYTYFEANDFSGKTLIPFSTHAGSDLSGFDRKLGNAAPGADIGTGLAVRGSDTQNNTESVRSSVNDWLSGLEF